MAYDTPPDKEPYYWFGFITSRLGSLIQAGDIKKDSVLLKDLADHIQSCNPVNSTVQDLKEAINAYIKNPVSNGNETD